MGSLPIAPNAKPVGSYPKSGIDVLIVGTGLAGLTAAIECTRKGHNVRVLERNATINTAGDMYFMGLSATKFMKHWPELAEEYNEISLHDAWIETFKHDGESMIKPQKVAERLRAAGLDAPPGSFQMRPLVYTMFVRQVERLGINVEFSKRVVDYFEDADGEAAKGGVITDDGKRYEADIVIAADGVGSKSQKLVGGQVRAQKSGRAMWRAAFPRKELDKNPEVKAFFGLINGTDPIVRTWLGPSTYGLTLTRPDLMVWIVNHEATGSESESWNNIIEADEVLEDLNNVPGPKWASIFKELVKCTPPKTILNFELLWRNPQPTWTSPGSRVVQIGDSAHSYLPASGNGATQAIEDAVSLASCLQIGGKENIAQSIRAHIKMRFVRNSCAQKLGFSNAMRLQDTKWDKVKKDPRQATPSMPKWIYSHDPEVYAYENYDKAVESMKLGIPLEDDDDNIPPNYPPGYKYSPWNIEKIMDDMRNGRPVDLGPGDWS